MNKKPLFAIHYYGEFGQSMQPVKAIDEAEAKTKFLKRFPKRTRESIFDCNEIEPSEKHYNYFRQHSI